MATAGIKISASITLSGVPDPHLSDPHVWGFALHFVRRGASAGTSSSPNITWDSIKSEFTVEIERPATPPTKQDPEDPTSWVQTGSTFQLTFPGTEGGETGDAVALQPGVYLLAAVRIDLQIPVYLYAGADFNADAALVTVPKFYANPGVHMQTVTLTQHSWNVP